MDIPMSRRHRIESRGGENTVGGARREYVDVDAVTDFNNDGFRLKNEIWSSNGNDLIADIITFCLYWGRCRAARAVAANDLASRSSSSV